jgi:hypothetical protein
MVDMITNAYVKIRWIAMDQYGKNNCVPFCFFA